MDFLKSRESLNSRGSDHDPLFYSSDEFMVDLLKSPVQGQGLEPTFLATTHKGLDIMKAPRAPLVTEKNELRAKLNMLARNVPNSGTYRREDMDKGPCFTSKFSDGVVVKQKPPPRGRKKGDRGRTSPSFLKSPVSSRSPGRSQISRKKTAAAAAEYKAQNLDLSTRSDGGALSPRQKPFTLPLRQSLSGVKTLSASDMDWSADLSIRESESESDDMAGVARGENPRSPASLLDASSPTGNARHKGMRKSSSARLQVNSGKSTLSPLSASYSGTARSLSLHLTGSLPPPPLSPSRSPVGRRKSSRRASQGQCSLSRSPKASQPRRNSSWLATTPVPKPKTPKSKRSSSRSGRKSRTLSISMPNLHLTDAGGEDQEKPLAFLPNGPPMIRPLNKTLMRDYPSTTTATTFLTADTDAADYSMAPALPVTTSTERLLFKRVPNKRDLIVESSEGDRIATVDYSMVNQGKRFIKDACGRTCAIIFLFSDKLEGGNLFKICGVKPASRRQRLSNETGYYTWAEVKNSGSFGGKFVMNSFNPQTSSCNGENYYTKPFGSLFSRGKSKGYVFYDSKKKECAKMVSLEKGRGIVVKPNRDLCYMLAFAAVVDEMVEYRLR